VALSYQAALEFLYPRTTTVKFGLETTRALLKELGDPQLLYPTVHIGGTNGKGSVSTLVAEALRAAGGGWGFTPPPPAVVQERVRSTGSVSEAAVAWTERLAPLIAGARRSTGDHRHRPGRFRRPRHHIAVIEVGLGGRLDSKCWRR
jgi:dihydrofolate synthase/folylpolyglutamate synthase